MHIKYDWNDEREIDDASAAETMTQEEFYLV